MTGFFTPAKTVHLTEKKQNQTKTKPKLHQSCETGLLFHLSDFMVTTESNKDTEASNKQGVVQVTVKEILPHPQNLWYPHKVRKGHTGH